MNVDYTLIGKRIKEARKMKNYTQEWLAEQLDVSVGYVSQVERGITKISLDLLAEITSVLNCDLAVLVTGAAVKSDHYLEEEITQECRKLNHQEKKLLMGMIHLILENRLYSS